MIFFAATFFFYYFLFTLSWEILGRSRYFKLFILVSSVIFFALFAGIKALTLLLVSSILTYVCFIIGSKISLLLGILLNTILLCYYKFIPENSVIANFIDGKIDSAFPIFLHYEDMSWISTYYVPLGISFFVFEFIHLLADKSRNRALETSLLDFLIFAFFWPTVVAGPIKRFEQFSIRKLESGSTIARFSKALPLISIGIMYKLIADGLNIYVRQLEPNIKNLDSGNSRLLLLLVGLRIFLDFAGYSYIAIGIGAQIGVFIPQNFRAPYLASNIQDFWQRWHISLSTWIRDYIYIPLGGNRKGFSRKLLHLFLAMIICGAWHGGTWNFIFWGAYHGALLVTYHTYKKVRRIHPYESSNRNKKVTLIQYASRSISWILTQIMVFVGWAFFFFPLNDAFLLLGKVF